MIQAVDRALRILAVLGGGRRMSLGEISAAIDLAPSTVHGLVRTLLAHGMVQQEADSGRYRLGPATLRLGNVYLDTLELRSRVAIWAEGLARRTGCAVRTAVLLRDEVVVVAHEPRPDGTRQMPEVGIVIPAHASALGKALLAFSPEALTGPLRSMTGDTVTDTATLAEQLVQVRATGIASEVEEAILGECALAATVFDTTEQPAGAISLVVPAGRCHPRRSTRCGTPHARCRASWALRCGRRARDRSGQDDRIPLHLDRDRSQRSGRRPVDHLAVETELAAVAWAVDGAVGDLVDQTARVGADRRKGLVVPRDRLGDDDVADNDPGPDRNVRGRGERLRRGRRVTARARVRSGVGIGPGIAARAGRQCDRRGPDAEAGEHGFARDRYVVDVHH